MLSLERERRDEEEEKSVEEAIALEGPSLAAAFRFIMDLRFSLLIPPKIAPNKKNHPFLSILINKSQFVKLLLAFRCKPSISMALSLSCDPSTQSRIITRRDVLVTLQLPNF